MRKKMEKEMPLKRKKTWCKSIRGLKEKSVRRGAI